jgi:hypothetical protein
VLVSASYDPVGLVVTLGFDRLVRTVGIDGTQISLDDPVTNAASYLGTGGIGRVDPMTLTIYLVAVGAASGSQTMMSATTGNGVVARIGSGLWLGVTNLVLPFP